MEKLSKAYCKSVAFSDIITVSSAYNKINNFKNTKSSSSIHCSIVERPLTSLSIKKSSRSLIKRENKKEDKFSPCRTPTLQLKNQKFYYPS
jgi:hypothetical protein